MDNTQNRKAASGKADKHRKKMTVAQQNKETATKRRKAAAEVAAKNRRREATLAKQRKALANAEKNGVTDATDNVKESDGVQKKKKRDTWPIKAVFITFSITMVLSFLSETTLQGVSLVVAIIVLFVIISIGIMFDIIGVAVTSGSVTAYNSMASKKIKGAKNAIRLVKSASTVSNICNDIVGDICGIVSGAMGATIAISIYSASPKGIDDLLTTIVVSSVIASATVAGKATGKQIAMKNSHKIVFTVGKILSVFARESEKKGRKK